MTHPTSFAVCIRNDGYPAALEVRKHYRVLPDADAGDAGLIRVIDESGEDYLYPTEFFVSIELPRTITDVLESAA